MNSSTTESVHTGFVLLLSNGEYIHQSEGLGHLGTRIDRQAVKALNQATIFSERQLKSEDMNRIEQQFGQVMKLPAYVVRTVALGTPTGNEVKA